jgi:hypothetical protein
MYASQNVPLIPNFNLIWNLFLSFMKTLLLLLLTIYKQQYLLLYKISKSMPAKIFFLLNNVVARFAKLAERLNEKFVNVTRLAIRTCSYRFE